MAGWDAASDELAAHVGLQAGRVRLAAFQTVLSTLVPDAASELAPRHPGVELNLVDAHPPEALAMLRNGKVDVALIFRHPDTPHEGEGFRLTHLLDDPLHLLSREPDQQLVDHRDSLWVGGCERCRATLVAACERVGFSPRIAYSTDDMVVVQSLVAAGMGVGTLPGLALQAHRVPDVHATPRQRCPAGCRPIASHTRRRVGSPIESEPAGHLDRVWPDTDPAGSL